MKELQQKFLILKIEERYEPFTYVWSTMAYRWGDALAQARALRRADAAYQVMKRYFLIAGYGNQRTAARVLGIESQLAGAAIVRLEREGILMTYTSGRIGPPGSYALTEAHLRG
jgi:hypothetical protein